MLTWKVILAAPADVYPLPFARPRFVYLTYLDALLAIPGIVQLSFFDTSANIVDSVLGNSRKKLSADSVFGIIPHYHAHLARPDVFRFRSPYDAAMSALVGTAYTRSSFRRLRDADHQQPGHLVTSLRVHR